MIGRPLRLTLALLVMALAFMSHPAQAHFVLNGKNRIFLVEREADAVNVYLRLPAPLAYAAPLAKRRAPTDEVQAPFVVPERVNGQTLHLLDVAAIQADPMALAAMVAEGYRVTVGGVTATPVPQAAAVHKVAPAPPPFATLDEARAALVAGLPAGERPFVGDAVIDVLLRYEGVNGAAPITIVSILPELTLPADVFIDNHLVDFGAGQTTTTSLQGQLHEPVLLDQSRLRSVLTFVHQGILHILDGPDHVLFVLCLTLAATSLGMLFWQVTGFTIGHSITLIGGFLGFAPSGSWFTPTIETAIALSIIYAGLVALWRRPMRGTVLVTAAIGLMHGFGFSFVLGEILGRNAPDLLVSLLSFNLGVEIGQIAIVTVAWLGLALATRISRPFGSWLRVGIAGAAIAIACFWVVERAQLVAGALRQETVAETASGQRQS